MTKTKIIVTYGPSLEDKKVLKNVLKYVDIVRINFSHGDQKSWVKYANNVRQISKQMGREIALLADLPGPKMRIGKLDKSITVKTSQKVTFSSDQSDKDAIPVEYWDFHRDCRVGMIISIGDGYLKFKVKGINGRKVRCTAISSGILEQKKGINLHNTEISAKVPTDEDVKLAKFAASNKFDFIGMSFVRSADDVNALKKILPNAFIIAKIERKEAVSRIKYIANAADAIMVARGDLALDIEIEKIPIAQRAIITASQIAHKPVIVATQVLASMVTSNIPTRAEVNDIAGAVISGTDCIMLSDETTIGKYPLEAVKVLHNTIRNAESFLDRSTNNSIDLNEVSGSIAFAAAEIANNFNADCIFAPSQTGATAIRLSSLKPKSPIIAMVVSPETRRKLSIYHGIEPIAISRYPNTDTMFKIIEKEAQKRGFKSYVVVFGTPNKPGSTDTLRYIEK